MKKDYTKYLAAAVGVVVTTAVVAGATYAYQGDSNKKGPNFSPERHEAMIQAIDNQDYETWQELMGDNPVTEKITEENFAKFIEARQLMVDGKYEEAKNLREELGLKAMRGEKKGFHKRQQKSPEEFEAIKQALDNQDYETWKELMSDKPFVENITEDNFTKLIEIHNLKQAGKHEEAKALWEESGLDFGHGKKGFHKRQK